MHFHVRAQRHSLCFHDLAQDTQVPERAFLINKVRAGQQLTRCVVNRAHQAHAWATTLEPVMQAAIPQDSLTRLWPTIAPSPMLRRAPLARTVNSCTAQNPLNRLARDAEALDLAELLREVLIIEAFVLRQSQLEDGLLDQRCCL